MVPLFAGEIKQCGKDGVTLFDIRGSLSSRSGVANTPGFHEDTEKRYNTFEQYITGGFTLPR
ncbi:MAG: hypothetical protein FWE95_01220 [Planctomycetaceae bacterium]|nr:hypothetical protein [Planctomycetaceae bacterium]